MVYRTAKTNKCTTINPDEAALERLSVSGVAIPCHFSPSPSHLCQKSARMQTVTPPPGMLNNRPTTVHWKEKSHWVRSGLFQSAPAIPVTPVTPEPLYTDPDYPILGTDGNCQNSRHCCKKGIARISGKVVSVCFDLARALSAIVLWLLKKEPKQ